MQMTQYGRLSDRKATARTWKSDSSNGTLAPPNGQGLVRPTVGRLIRRLVTSPELGTKFGGFQAGQPSSVDLTRMDNVHPNHVLLRVTPLLKCEDTTFE